MRVCKFVFQYYNNNIILLSNILCIYSESFHCFDEFVALMMVMRVAGGYQQLTHSRKNLYKHSNLVSHIILYSCVRISISLTNHFRIYDSILLNWVLRGDFSRHEHIISNQIISFHIITTYLNLNIKRVKENKQTNKQKVIFLYALYGEIICSLLQQVSGVMYFVISILAIQLVNHIQFSFFFLSFFIRTMCQIRKLRSDSSKCLQHLFYNNVIRFIHMHLYTCVCSVYYI